MKKIKLIVTALAMFAATFTAFAQNIKVSGTVVDQDGQPVPAAAVQLEGTMTGTITSIDGTYSISAPANGSLVFSAMGYETVTTAIGGKTTVNATLREDSKFLDEAIIVGYGSAKKVGSIVGSVTTVKAEAIKNTPTQSALDKLQGQVAGLSVMTTGGVAGDNSISMRLHGVGSLSAGSEPLYIIDGIPSSTRAIMGLNPNDISTISVLKDASATSIYGARAANGVVFITTKGGSYSSDATVNVRYTAGVSTLSDWSLYTNMMNSAELKDFFIRSGQHTAETFKKTYTDKGFNADTKWYEYFQRVWTHQNQTEVSIEGGSRNVAYMVGFSQFHQEGTTIGNFYDRYTISSNIQGHPKSWLKFGLKTNLYLTQRQSNSNWNDSSQSNDSVYLGGMGSYLWNPLYPAVDEEGNVYEERFPMGTANQYKYFEYNKDIYSDYGLMGSAFMEIELIDNLFLQSRLGTDSYIDINNWTYMPSYYRNAGSGTRGRSTGFYSTNTITNTLEYKLDIGDLHKINLLAGQEGTAYFGDYYYASSREQTDDRLMNLQNGSTKTRAMSESYSAYRFLSFFGHADYSFANKYIVDLTVRNDSSSRFGENNRSATFWAAGAMWKIKRENFLKNVSWVNDLNLKLSYGTQGNAALPSNYLHLGLIGSTGAYNGTTGKALAQPANPDLTWEQQDLLTVALTGRIFDKIDFDVEYYHRKTSRMLMEVPFPYTTGFRTMYSNVGGMLNQGLDLTLGVDFLRGRDYYLRLDTTFGYNAEKITELFNGEQRWDIASTGLSYVVGNPISFYQAVYAGVDPADGRQMWYLPGENIDVTTKDPSRVTKSFDEDTLRQNTGMKLHAPVTGGFSLSGAWKGFSARADFSYVIGKYLLNNDAFFYANPNVAPGYNQRKDVTDFWTPYNTDAKYPDWSAGQTMQFDTHLIEDASFLRLKALQIGYSFKNLLGWQKAFSDIRLNFTGRNLFTLTNYSGIDPEVDSNLTVGIPGNTKQLLLGVEVTF